MGRVARYNKRYGCLLSVGYELMFDVSREGRRRRESRRTKKNKKEEEDEEEEKRGGGGGGG